MFEFLKDGFEALGQRIRSPFIGSIALVFLATNWKPLVYLFYADKTIRAKFLFFDANTSIATLYILPIILGILLALSAPWLKLLGAEWAKFPSKKLKTLQEDEARAHRIYQFKQSAQEERALAELEDAKERRVIDASKRLSEAEQVSEEAKEDVEASRSENEESDLPSHNVELGEYDLNVIEKIVIETLGAETNKPLSTDEIVNRETYVKKIEEKISNFSSQRLKIQTHDAINSLYDMGLVKSDGGGRNTLTSKGYTVYDILVSS